MTKVYDCVIIGGGPAGYSAAIYAKRAGLAMLLLDKSFLPGGQMTSTYEVDNYPGMPGISGADLGEAFAAHAEKLGVNARRETVRSISEDSETGEKLVCTNKETYCTRTVIVAVGARHRTLGIPGEEELSGMGVSYCATCDGAFFRDRTAAVIGGGNVAVEDAIFLARICKKVYLVHRRESLRADKILQESLFACENVEILWNAIPCSIEGQEQVEALVVDSVKGEAQRRLSVDGVFVAVGILPNTEFLEGFLETDEAGYLKAGEDCAASVPGVFAAGDVRTKKLRQVLTGAADGANAVASVQEYLMEYPVHESAKADKR